eukprot:6207163-Pleurochrysis_carterae.AAC.1
MEAPLILDPAIRDWVLIPIVIIMFLVGLLRNNVMKMMRKEVPPNRTQVQHNNQLMRARRLRANSIYIPPSAFAARKHYFVAKDSGILMQKMEAPNPMTMMQGGCNIALQSKPITSLFILRSVRLQRCTFGYTSARQPAVLNSEAARAAAYSVLLAHAAPQLSQLADILCIAWQIRIR